MIHFVSKKAIDLKPRAKKVGICYCHRKNASARSWI